MRRQTILTLSRKHRKPEEMGTLFFESPQDAGLLRAVIDPETTYTRQQIEDQYGPLTVNEPIPDPARWQNFYGRLSFIEFARLISALGVHITFDGKTTFWRSMGGKQ